MGHHQRQTRRAFIAANGAAVPTSVLMAWCYPGRDRLERWRWNIVARAAHRFGVNVGRGWWRPNDELAARIRGDDAGSDVGTDAESQKDI
jgi:hypothetical protein